MGRYLIVANQTLGGLELEEKIRDRIAAGAAEFYVLVPMIEPELEAESWVPADPAFGVGSMGALNDEAVAEAQKRSEHRLQRMIAKIEEAGGDAQGEVGDADPTVAVEDVLRRRPAFDEIIVSTLPARISRWLKMDLPSRIDRMVDIPVTTVEADS